MWYGRPVGLKPTRIMWVVPNHVTPCTNLHSNKYTNPLIQPMYVIPPVYNGICNRQPNHKTIPPQQNMVIKIVYTHIFGVVRIWSAILLSRICQVYHNAKWLLFGGSAEKTLQEKFIFLMHLAWRREITTQKLRHIFFNCVLGVTMKLGKE